MRTEINVYSNFTKKYWHSAAAHFHFNITLGTRILNSFTLLLFMALTY